MWQSRFGGDPQIIGRKIRNGGDVGTVIGVTSPDFDFPRDVDLFVPLRAAWPTVEQQPNFRVFRAVGKLRPGVSVEAAQTRLSVLAAQASRDRKGSSETAGVLVTALPDEIFGPARLAVLILLGAVFVVLLIACANVANLLLARGTARARELALRSVLGAGRARVVSLLLTESLLIAVAAAGIGFVLASAGVRMLAGLAPPEIPRLDEIALNGPVLLFGIAVSLGTVLLFGLGPALAAARRDPAEALRQGGRSQSAGRGTVHVRQWLTAAQVAFSVALLIGAGLLIRSFQSLSSVDPGFRADNILTFRITTNTGSQEKRRNLYNGVLERMRALPGVVSAGAVLLRPLSGIVGWDAVYTVEGQTPEVAASNPNGNYEAVSPQYFSTWSSDGQRSSSFWPVARGRNSVRGSLASG
ncbi:MAG: FtsX-like permease family protein [Bryobacteraceae bacterium]|nr:FtsX-like permease family protein [Bryobacteraceae bacterium]